MFESNNLIFKIGAPEIPDRVAAVLRIVGFLSLLIWQLQPAPDVLPEKSFLLMDGTRIVGEFEEKPYGYNVDLGEEKPRYVKKDEVIAIMDVFGFSIPAWVFMLGAFYFLFFLPASFMSFVYNLVALPVYWLNALYAFISGRSHEELNRYLIKQIAFDIKTQAMSAGLVDRFVHVDLYAREAEPFPVVFQARAETGIDRVIALLRLTVIVPLLVFLPYLIVWAAYSLAFVVLAVAHWCMIAATGRPHEKIFELLENFLRYQGRLRLFMVGLVNRPPPFHGAMGPEAELDFDFDAGEEPPPVEDEYYGTGASRSLEINLIVYTLLLVFSLGVYSYLWLARVTKVMGHDPFTIIGMCLLLPLLPLSIIFVRYYRRAEKLLKNEPSFILEVLAALPFLNLLIAPLLIQLVLNEYERARRMQKARAA